MDERCRLSLKEEKLFIRLDVELEASIVGSFIFSSERSERHIIITNLIVDQSGELFSRAFLRNINHLENCAKTKTFKAKMLNQSCYEMTQRCF